MTAWRVGLQARLVAAVWAVPPGSARQAGLAALAAAAGAAAVLALQAPELARQRAEAQQRHQALGEKLASLQAQQAQLRQALATGQAGQTWQAVAVPAAGGSADGAAPGVSNWHWHRLARQAGLRVAQLQPVSRQAGEPAALQLRVQGRYHQHGALVAALASVPQAQLLSYRLQAGEAGSHAAELRLLPLTGAQALPLAALPWVPGPAHDPLAEPAVASALAPLPDAWRAERERPRQWLEQLPLAALELSGTLRRGQAWVALVRSPHATHSVRVGDYLGPDFGRVQRIDEPGLWLRELRPDAQGQWQAHERHWRVGQQP